MIIDVEQVKKEIIEVCKTLVFEYPKDVKRRLLEAKMAENNERAVLALNMLEDNMNIALDKHIPICQDTGMVIVYMQLGYDVCFNGDINEAINEAVRIGYQDNYLRKSVVSDPLFDRINTKDNTPCVIHVEYIKESKLIIDICAKGFGSENMSRVMMLKPAMGVNGVKDFVIETVKKAGPNAGPPMVIGVGIGGSFDNVTYLAKKALFRDLDSSNPDSRYKQLEYELLTKINELNIGPLGLKGKTTALKVNIEYYPTHIAALPVAVNICCHVSRHARVVIS